MSGAFQTSREIFASPIWKNIVDFRVFFLIYGSAVFSDDVRLADDLVLKRGEWCRSIRKMQEDLQYIENRQIKTYSTSVLSRCIKRLVDMQMVCTRMHELGTVFTVVNYEKYQRFEGYRKQNLERNLEQSGNSGGTVGEQSGNNNKKENKDNKVEEKENKRSSRKRTVYEVESIPYRSAGYLWRKIQDHSPEHKEPNLQAWANDMRLMIENDNRSPVTIAAVIDWATSDNFWKSNILSAAKLRSKFDTLQLQMKRGGQSGKYGRSTQGNEEENRRLADKDADLNEFSTEEFYLRQVSGHGHN